MFAGRAWRTLDWFDGRCAYSGEELVEVEIDRDHAIPMSRAHCGLHLYGNVLPATREANGRKAGKHYREFVEDPECLELIEAFVRESGWCARGGGAGGGARCGHGRCGAGRRDHAARRVAVLSWERG